MKKISKQDFSKKYAYMYDKGIINFILEFLKISIVHVIYEVLITVSIVSFLLCYFPSFSGNRMLPITEYFSTVVFTCSFLYMFFLIIYALIVVAAILWFLKRYDENLCGSYIKYLRLCAIAGLVSYIVAALATATWPQIFTGRNVSLPILSRVAIALLIVFLGILWCLLSIFRYKRINWSCILDHPSDLSNYCSCDVFGIKDTKDNCRINHTTLKYSMIGASTQAIAIALIIGGHIGVWMVMNIDDSGYFDYYYLILAVQFAIISTYTSFCIKKEFLADYPWLRSCSFKKKTMVSRKSICRERTSSDTQRSICSQCEPEDRDRLSIAKEQR